MNNFIRANALLAVLVVSFILVVQPAWALSSRVAVCTPAKTAPTLDGKLDDACWKTAGVMTDFMLDNGKGLASDRTVARACFDKRYLYLAVECFESDFSTVKANITTHDGNVDSDDDIEILIDVNKDRKTFYHFLANSLGTKAEILNGGREWDCNWTVRVSKSADRWTAEIAIPMKVLGGAKIGLAWGFNLGRGQAGKKSYASFAGATGKWANPNSFASLRFAARANGEGRIFPERGGFRVYALHPQKRLDLERLPAKGEEYRGTFATPGEYVPFAFHVFNLETKNALSATIKAEPFRGDNGATIPVPPEAYLHLYPRMAGGYAWEFLGHGAKTTIPPGQRGGFWVDLKLPENAKPGLYASKVSVTVTIDGKQSTETRTAKLLVLPFKLDVNPTSCGFHYPKEPPALMRESLGLMREHGMTIFVPLYGGWGLGGVETFVKMYKEFGFTGKMIYADSVMYIGDRLARQMNLPHRGPKLRDSNRTWKISNEYKRRYVAAIKKYYDEAVRLGHPEMCFSIGDELTSDGFWGAQHLIDRAQALREGIPKISLTSDMIGVKEAVGASKYLNSAGVNSGWSGPDNHNSGQDVITPVILKKIIANGCKPEFVNTGTDRYPFGFYLWRMHKTYGIDSKVEWIWHSSRLEPQWRNVHREDGKTYVTVALKFSRMGTYDTRYAATLDNLLKKRTDARAQQLIDDVIAHVPVSLKEARADSWTPERNDAVRWMIAKEIARLKGKSVGATIKTTALDIGQREIVATEEWNTVKLEKKFVRHKSRTFGCPKVQTAPKMDGELNDEVWKSAEIITGAYDDHDLSLVEGMMTVRLIHTDKGVYLGIVSHEPEPDKIATSTKGRDDPGLWRVDDIELFLTSTKSGTYYHLVYDAKGTKSDYLKQDISWNGKWQVATKLEGNLWTSEVFLPWETFGGKVQWWKIFVGRGSPTRGKYYGIMPIKGSWHDVNQFGLVYFGIPWRTCLREIDFGRLQAGANKVSLVVTNPGPLGMPGKVELLLSDGQTATVPVKPTPGGTQKVTIPFNVKSAGEIEMTLALKDFAGRTTGATETFIANVPELMSVSLDHNSVFGSDNMRSGKIALNLTGKQLAGHSIEMELNSRTGVVKLPFSKVTGNRLKFSFMLSNPSLTEGKHTLTVRLLKNRRKVAERKKNIFMVARPVFSSVRK